MKIVHIVPGSGATFYCQNCLRDASLVAALREAGHDAFIVPMYLPLFTDRDDIQARAPVFYGAVAAYLRDQSPLFRRLPPFLRRLLDSSPVLAYAARKAGSTRASGLEHMTLSVLKGEAGAHGLELDRLAEWLSAESRPDIIHLSNALLIGLAGRLRSRLRAPVVCSLQDEEGWIEAMAPADRARIWQAMSDKVPDVDAFISVSHHYASVMRGRMNIPDGRLHVAHIGLRPAEYSAAPEPADPPIIGFLSRMSPALGLDILADAFLLLKQEPRFQRLRLAAMGGTLGEDARFLDRLDKTFRARQVWPDVSFLPEFGHASRLDFLRSLSALSVPVPRGEAFGVYLIEAMACGIPVVQPRLGAFPEVVEKAGGGLLYEPNNAPTLAAHLRLLLDDPERARSLGARGREGVARHFTIGRMADTVLAVYRTLTSPSPPTHAPEPLGKIADKKTYS